MLLLFLFCFLNQMCPIVNVLYISITKASVVCLYPGAASRGGAHWYHQHGLHVQVSGHVQDTSEYFVLF